MTDRPRPSTPSDPFVLVMLGEPTVRYRDVWSSRPAVKAIVTLPSAAPQGKRRGRRSLGLGVDALRVAVKSRFRYPSGRYLATNPWIGVALRLLGARRLAVLGIYAESGSRSWRLLRAILGQTPIVTPVSTESEAWNASGGDASHVLYAAHFDYPDRVDRPGDPGGPVRIFIGGSSDRDRAVVETLEREMAGADRAVDLVVAIGGPSSSRVVGTGSTVTHLPVISQREFGLRLSESDVVFLPLAAGTRAAGHMVAVGALQVGVPVVTTASAGMTGYVDGTYVIELEAGAVLPQLVAQAERFRGEAAAEVRAFWRERHDLESAADEILARLAPHRQ